MILTRPSTARDDDKPLTREQVHAERDMPASTGTASTAAAARSLHGSHGFAAHPVARESPNSQLLSMTAVMSLGPADEHRRAADPGHTARSSSTTSAGIRRSRPAVSPRVLRRDHS